MERTRGLPPLYRTDAVSITMDQQVEQWLRRGHWYAWWPASWVGPAAPHHVHELVKEFGGHAECRCGSRQAYGDCRCREDQLAVGGPAS
jgi:hypothetical protein